MDIKKTKTKYEIDGIAYDRVTSVLDYFTPPSLITWRDKVGTVQAKKIAKTAKAIGTRVHKLAKVHWEKGYINLTQPLSQLSVRFLLHNLRPMWPSPQVLSDRPP